MDKRVVDALIKPDCPRNHGPRHRWALVGEGSAQRTPAPRRQTFPYPVESRRLLTDQIRCQVKQPYHLLTKNHHLHLLGLQNAPLKIMVPGMAIRTEEGEVQLITLLLLDRTSMKIVCKEAGISEKLMCGPISCFEVRSRTN